MTERKWTPGPWHYERADIHHICHQGTVCDVTTVCNLENGEHAAANAHLIAAAPDLYEAAQLGAELAAYYDDDDDYLTIEAALFKARGFAMAKYEMRPANKRHERKV